MSDTEEKGGRRRKRQRGARANEEQAARQDRALRHPIYLISWERAGAARLHFCVLGTTQVAYGIDFIPPAPRVGSAADGKEAKEASKTKRAAGAPGPTWTCECKDFERRQAACKHIQFVWYRVLSLLPADVDPAEGPFFDGVDAAADRIRDTLAHLAANSTLLSSSRPAGAEPATTGAAAGGGAGGGVAQRPHVGEMCPICYEAFAAEEPVYYCSSSCGNSVHKTCFDVCVDFTRKADCPYCRSEIPGVRPRPKKRARVRY
jgi:Ring finger domain